MWSNLERLKEKWDPRGVLVSDARALAAVRTLKAPRAACTLRQRRDAAWVLNAAVHPVLEQPVPSAFRHGSFLPVTSLVALGLASTKNAAATILWHTLYQSHAAGLRYVNYANTERPLDANRMLMAYGASTAAACGLGAGLLRLTRWLPRLRPVALVAPHLALSAAGALSTLMNNKADLDEGVVVTDGAGNALGTSHVAARASCARAVLFQALLIPTCALLVPALTMRVLVAPRLIRSRYFRWTLPVSGAIILSGTCVLTPLAAAAFSPHISVPVDDLEEPLRERLSAAAAGSQRVSEVVWSSRVLY